MKISREGIVLIKSFEGFRPRAIKREAGGWIIGYGHTLSAREGASVSEADAELLLRYDLLPVEKTLNEIVPVSLNQHQFDALASFAFSVGLDRFAGSDVRQRLSAGSPSEAADAMMGWPEPALPESALRRRVAERALFCADPAVPVALADLLAAPLPPPPLVPMPEADAPVSTADPRGAAVAALLGEPHALAEEEAAASPAPAVNAIDAASSTEPHEAALDSLSSEGPVPPVENASPAFLPIAGDASSSSADVDPVAMAAARYAPYSAAMVGPLPYLQPANPQITPNAEPVILETLQEAVPAPLPTGTAALPSDEAPALPDGADAPPPPVEPAYADHLVLTAPEDAPEPAMARALWTPEQRAEPAPAENGLFGEDMTLTHAAGPIMGYETEPQTPARFDWSETGAFIIMGAVGLTAFGASMAAFRLASEQSDGGSETTMIAWVLAVIGAACVGVSSFNLYRRWGLPGGD